MQELKEAVTADTFVPFGILCFSLGAKDYRELPQLAEELMGWAAEAFHLADPAAATGRLLTKFPVASVFAASVDTPATLFLFVAPTPVRSLLLCAVSLSLVVPVCLSVFLCACVCRPWCPRAI